MAFKWVCLASLFSLVNAGGKNPKRGIGYAGDVPDDIFNANQTKSLLSWQYNWADIPPNYLATSNLPYVPMQWGSASIDTFSDAVQIQDAPVILTFNEPDYVAESNMQPEEAAQLWMQYIEPLKAQGVRLGGPAVTASSTGLPWLSAFFAACSNCTVDFLPLHWYGSGVEGFYAYLWNVHNAYPKLPIWITEYAETSTNDTVVLDFMNQTTIYMDSLDWIERYAWFGYFRPRQDVHYNLLRDDGGLNALGELYLGAKTVHTSIIAAPTNTYQVVNGADSPSALPVTTWPALHASSGRHSTLYQHNIQVVSYIVMVVCTITGGIWTLI